MGGRGGGSPTPRRRGRRRRRGVADGTPNQVTPTIRNQVTPTIRNRVMPRAQYKFTRPSISLDEDGDDRPPASESARGSIPRRSTARSLALQIGNDPVTLLGIEADRHLLARTRLTQGLVPVVQRDPAIAVGTPIPDPLRQEGIDPAQVPQWRLVHDAVGAPQAAQFRI